MVGVEDKFNKPNLITTDQTHEIYMVSLQKGWALQRMINVINRNSKNVSAMKNALFRLKENAFGDEHQTTVSFGDQKGTFRLSQAQFKLLRQEQLMLLLENQRLVEELQKIRKMNLTGFSSPNPQATRKTASAKTSKLVKSIDRTLMGENEVNLMRTKLLYFVSTFEKVRHRVLSNALMTIFKLGDSSRLNHASYLNPQRYNVQSKKVACLMLENVLRKKVNTQLSKTLSVLQNYNRVKPPPPANYLSYNNTGKEVNLVGAHKSYHNRLPSSRNALNSTLNRDTLHRPNYY